VFKDLITEPLFEWEFHDNNLSKNHYFYVPHSTGRTYVWYVKVWDIAGNDSTLEGTYSTKE